MNEPARIEASPDAPPAFAWERWYGSIGGRTIEIAEVTRILRAIRDEQLPRFEGEVAPRPASAPEPAEVAAAIKDAARSLGAEMVGVCELEPSDLYRGRAVDERYAIALGKVMRYREFEVVPSERSAIECVRVYHELGEICIALAHRVRAMGWPARVEHPIGDSNILHVPVALKAGFGELGRHGSVIHPVHGPLFRMGSVLTSMPMATDSPVDAGIAAFCDRCRACRIFCPADAIPDERDPEAGVDPLGHARYVVDTGKCFSYFARHGYCSACLPACVYEHKAWARDFERGEPVAAYPRVVFHPPPPPADAVPAERRHRYPRVGRDGIVPEWVLRARRKHGAGA